MQLIDNFVVYYASKFTNGNKSKAEDRLHSRDTSLRKKDTMVMSFFSGGLVVTFTMLMFIFGLDTGYEYEDWKTLLQNNMPAFRLAFMLIFVLLGATIVITIYKKYKVNYMFIFECDPNYRMT